MDYFHKQMLQKRNLKEMSFDALFMQILYFPFIVKLKIIYIKVFKKIKGIDKFKEILCSEVKKK